METSLHLLLSSGYLPDKDRSVLLGTHVLVKYLDKMRRALSTCDFQWIRNIDKNWENQTEISSKNHWPCWHVSFITISTCPC